MDADPETGEAPKMSEPPGTGESPQTPSQVFYPANFHELFSSWSRFPDAVPYAGGTDIIRSQDKRVPALPRNILCLDKIEELKYITRTERYLEIGAMVRLNEIIALGKIVPEILIKTLEGIAGPQIRNTATIGGNLCHKSRRLDTTAPMTALDAHFELRTAQAARWISSSRFSNRPPLLEKQELLTRIRVPLDQWNYSVYRKFKSPGSDDSGGVIVFILKNQKNVLTDLRIVYSGNVLLQDRNIESLLIGKELPLNRRDAQLFLEKWKQYLLAIETTVPGAPPDEKQLNLLMDQIIAFIEFAILEISD